MEMDEIKKHWEKLAENYGTEIFATTKNENIKRLEINALYQQIEKKSDKQLNILEIGCGNGRNCIELAAMFPQHNFYGIDYVDEMVDNANVLKSKSASTNVNFSVGDVLKLSENELLQEEYDIVFTVRCLINLNTFELQCAAIKQISEKIKSGGKFLMLENSSCNYEKQNKARESISLNKRQSDPYNLFFSDNEITEYMHRNTDLRLEEIDNFSSLHDIILYVLLPAINENKVCYEEPIMEMVTKFLINNRLDTYNKFGDFGQNKLFILNKI